MNTQFAQRIAHINEALAQTIIDGTADGFFPHLSPKLPEGNEAAGVPLLVSPCRDIISGGGKRWRPLMMVLAYELAGGTSDSIYQLAPLIEGIHTASLIHDDIEDQSTLRRGKPAAHVQYGLDTALNAGSWLYFKALSCIDRYAADEALRLDVYNASVHTLCALHEGQALDIHWHRNPAYFPTRLEYERMISLKTGALAALAGYIGMRAAHKTHEKALSFASITALTGVGFQIADDVKNITAGNKGKKRGDDIVEGKKSLPVLIHVEKHPADAALLSAYFDQAKQEGVESPAVEAAIQRIHESGAVAEAAAQGRKVITDALEQLDAGYAGHPSALLLRDLVMLMQKE